MERSEGGEQSKPNSRAAKEWVRMASKECFPPSIFLLWSVLRECGILFGRGDVEIASNSGAKGP